MEPEDAETRKKGFKRVIYKHENIREARLKGVEYTNYKGQVVPAALSTVCSCRLHCPEAVSENDISSIWDNFRKLLTKNEQDCYLQNLMEIVPIKRRRPEPDRVDPETGIITAQKKTKNCLCKYTLNLPTGRVTVCRTMFVGVHGISLQRVRRISELLRQGKQPNDLRGKQNSGNAKDGETINKVIQHIASFPTKHGHYTGRDFYYLNERLNLKIMFQMFISNTGVKVSYTLYRNFFKERFKLTFGRPQVDTCQTCEELNIKIKSKSLCDSVKRAYESELIVHKRRAKKFYLKMKAIQERTKADRKIAAICMDYMQNLQLPNIPVQEVFYLRQVTLNVFCIHNLENENAMLYTYHEGIAGKGPNDVCSFLKAYIENIVNADARELHIFSDSCSAQNKNNVLVRMLLAYVEMKRFDKIIHYYPVRGHSYMSCDRDFGLLKRKICTTDRVYTIKEYMELMVTSSNIPDKFTIVMVNNDLLLDFKSWWPAYYKKSTISLESFGRNVRKDNKISFQISKFKELEYTNDAPGCVVAKEFIDCPITHTFRFKSTNAIPNMPSQPAYLSGKRPINRKKIEDIKKLASYIPDDPEIQHFYEELFNWPTTEQEELPEDL